MKPDDDIGFPYIIENQGELNKATELVAKQAIELIYRVSEHEIRLFCESLQDRIEDRLRPKS